ncbi:non-ribosomal peptide synthetase [Skermania sp. ID1734]|uniref:non-ribosomal peptide synthetase n=1 Tax=Skermania sp. ID1734 TaxID=2597516 RepID=UPI00163D9664|nr:non-ribosomal peptide synthetase [Skermania sp. ID1734]
MVRASDARSNREAEEAGLTFRLAPTQEGLWFVQQLHPEVPLVVAQYVEIRGPIDRDRLKAASVEGCWDVQSPGLRIVDVGGEVLQLLDPSVEDQDDLIYLDLRSAPDPVAEAKKWMVQQYTKPLDVFTDRLIAAALIHLGEDHYYWMSWVHHLVLDGHGAMTLMNRVAEYYTHSLNGTEPPPFRGIGIRKLYEAEQQYRNTSRFDIDREHWARRLARLPEPVSLADSTAAPTLVSRVFGEVLDAPTARGISEMAQRWNSSEVPVILAVLAAFLAQMTSRKDIVLSLPVSARTTKASRNSGGTVSNVVPIRVKIDPGKSLEYLVRDVQLELTGALRHQRYRYEDMRREFVHGAAHGATFGPTINIMMFHREIRLGDVTGEFNVLTTGPIADLAVNIYPSVAGQSIRIDFEGNPDLYSEATLREHLQRFLHYLRYAVANPERGLATLPLLTPLEIDTLRARASVPEEAPRSPITGSFECERRARRLARRLCDAGIGIEDRVAVIADDPVDRLVGIRAAALCGAASVPIDGAAGAEAIALVIADADVAAVLGSTVSLADTLPRFDLTADVDAESTRAFAEPHPDSLALIDYQITAGSSLTGVAHTHASLRTAPELVGDFGEATETEQVAILNRWLQPVPAGVVGDLYQLADLPRGIFGSSALTATQFVASPLANGRMLVTGQQARWSRDGNYEIVKNGDLATARLHRSPATRFAAVLPDRPRTPESVKSASVSDTVDVWRELVALGRRWRVPAPVVLHAVVSAVLSRLGPGVQTAIAVPVGGQMRTTRLAVEPQRSIREAVQRVRAEYARQITADEAMTERETAEQASPAIAIGWGARVLDSDADLDLSVDVSKDALALTIRYAPDTYEKSTAQSFLDHLISALHFVVQQPESRVKDIELAPSAPLIGGPAAPETTLPQLLTATAERFAERPAVIDGVQALTYAELDALSNKFARNLIGRGCGRGKVVGIALPRSVEFVISLWAIAKTGAAYLPLDPSQPDERLALLIENSHADLVIGDPEIVPGALSYVDLKESAEPEDSSALHTPVQVSDIAYVIFTSGSTGTPKGVQVTHRGLASLCAEGVQQYRVTPDSRVLHGYNPVFDAALLELLLAFGSGATLVVSPMDVFAGVELAEYLATQRVTHYLSTPSVLSSLEADDLPALQVIGVGGEPLPSELAARWVTGGRLLINAYGPSEATVVATLTAVSDAVTIGRPVRGTTAYVLDQWLRPVSVGGAGELYVAGSSLAQSYLGAPGVTAASFIANPFGEGRLYRTGDLVCRRADDSLGFVSRVDDAQVKIRGVRVELGEIEATVRGLAGVSDVAAIVSKDASGSNRLIAYVVPERDVQLDDAGLRAELAARLPSFLIPDAIVLLDELPVTANGKLDRAALALPDFHSTNVFRAPQGAIEKTIADVVAELLGVPRVGADDDFFELGGNSLLAARVVSHINEVLDANLTVRDIFTEPNVAGLARLLEEGPSSVRLRPYERPEVLPLAPAQRRIWVEAHRAPNGDWNIPSALRIDGPINIPALYRAVHDVMERHEPLRTIYPETDEGPVQVILDVDVDNVPFEAQRIAVDEMDVALQKFLWDPIDVLSDLPIRVALFEVAPQSHVVALVVHHISADGRSISVLGRDLLTAYLSRAAGMAPRWEPLAITYADYALWKHEVLGDFNDPDSEGSRQLQYWTNLLAEPVPVMTFPGAKTPVAVRGTAGAGERVHINAQTHAALARVARACAASLFMVMQAAWAWYLSRLSGNSDIVFATAIAGRDDPVLDKVVGGFADDVILRVQVDADVPFAELVRRVRLAALNAYAHPDIDNPRLQEALGTTDRLFQVQFIMQPGMAPVELEADEMMVQEHPIDIDLAKHDFEFSLNDHYDASGEPTGIDGWCIYSTDLFDSEAARGLVDGFIELLVQVGGHSPFVAPGAFGAVLAEPTDRKDA